MLLAVSEIAIEEILSKDRLVISVTLVTCHLMEETTICKQYQIVTEGTRWIVTESNRGYLME